MQRYRTQQAEHMRVINQMIGMGDLAARGRHSTPTTRTRSTESRDQNREQSTKSPLNIGKAQRQSILSLPPRLTLSAQLTK